MRGLAAHDLLPRVGDYVELFPGQVHGEDRGRGVADGQALAVSGDPLAIGHLHPRGRAVPRKDHVAVAVDQGQVG